MLDCCYERDTPNMSRAKRLKRGERNSVSCFCNSRSLRFGGAYDTFS